MSWSSLTGVWILPAVAALAASIAGAQVVPFAPGSEPPKLIDPARGVAPKIAKRSSRWHAPRPARATSADEPALSTAASGPATERFIRLPQNGSQRVVNVRTDESAKDQVVAAIERLGGTVRHQSLPGQIEAWMPEDALDALAAEKGVKFIHDVQPLEPTIGSVTDVEVSASGADLWHAVGIDGTGVKIGIVDTGFLSWDLAQSTGDWPPSERIEFHDMDGGGFGQGHTHGTRMVELMYDMAPGATFAVYENLTEFDVYDSIVQSVTDGVDILLVPLGAIGGSQAIGDGANCPPSIPAPCGSLSEAADYAKQNGVFIVNSPGNAAQAHWIGPYVDHPQAPGTHYWNAIDGNGLSPNICIRDGVEVNVRLAWSDTPAVEHDYDLEIYRLNDDGQGYTLYAASTDVQDGSGGQLPFEYVKFAASGFSQGCGAPDTSHYRILVAKIDAPTDQVLNLYAEMSLFRPIPDHSLVPPSDSPHVYTVTSVDSSSFLQLPIAGRGPALGPGGTLETPSVQKPDVSAVGQGTTSIDGAFEGVSVSSAFVAGTAGMVLQTDLSMTVPELAAEMDAIAVANPLAGIPDDVGKGLVRIGTSPPLLDTDGDGVPDDGDESGTAGDNPCLSGQTTDCDDNCSLIANAGLANPSWLGFGDQSDQDGDGVGDLCDVCVLVPNGPLAPDAGGNSQLNANADPFGNACDGDLDDSGRIDTADEVTMQQLIDFSLFDPVADLNGDGAVDTSDQTMLLGMGIAPGPAAGAVPCNNGVDDDGDGSVDFGADVACQGNPDGGAEVLGPGDPITIPDSALSDAIAGELGKPAGSQILFGELSTLTSLTAAGLGIADLTGLQFAASLETLDLRNNAISDVSILTGLPSLTTVYLFGNPGIGVPCDWNGDGSLTILDALEILKSIASLDAPSYEALSRRDVAPTSGPGDGAIGLNDAMVILHATMGRSVAACGTGG